MQSHFGSPRVATPVGLRRLPRHSHSVAKQASLSVAFRSDFGGFCETVREAKIKAKINFSEVFFDVFSECDFASILDQFLEARNLKNSNFP